MPSGSFGLRVIHHLRENGSYIGESARHGRALAGPAVTFSAVYPGTPP
ncbi:hypothetical protein T261_6304 [Streptomyces lydicus]|nr:hypothetical protein T261_6304 [Streptomyces lydicus]